MAPSTSLNHECLGGRQFFSYKNNKKRKMRNNLFKLQRRLTGAPPKSAGPRPRRKKRRPHLPSLGPRSCEAPPASDESPGSEAPPASDESPGSRWVQR